MPRGNWTTETETSGNSFRIIASRKPSNGDELAKITLFTPDGDDLHVTGIETGTGEVAQKRRIPGGSIFELIFSTSGRSLWALAERITKNTKFDAKGEVDEYEDEDEDEDDGSTSVHQFMPSTDSDVKLYIFGDTAEDEEEIERVLETDVADRVAAAIKQLAAEDPSSSFGEYIEDMEDYLDDSITIANEFLAAEPTDEERQTLYNTVVNPEQYGHGHDDL